MNKGSSIQDGQGEPAATDAPAAHSETAASKPRYPNRLAIVGGILGAASVVLAGLYFPLGSQAAVSSYVEFGDESLGLVGSAALFVLVALGAIVVCVLGLVKAGKLAKQKDPATGRRISVGGLVLGIVSIIATVGLMFLIPFSVAASGQLYTQASMESLIEDSAPSDNIHLTALTCPEHVKLTPGTSFDCDATEADGVDFFYHVVVVNSIGSRTWSAKPRYDQSSAESAMTDSFAAQGIELTAVQCPDHIDLEVGSSFQCTDDEVNGDQWVARGEVVGSLGELAFVAAGVYNKAFVEGEIKASVLDPPVLTITSVQCPEREAMLKDVTFQCTGDVSNGQKLVFDVTVVDDQGGFTWTATVAN